MLDALACVLCACTFIPLLLLLPPALREEYCPCCCCLPSLHLVRDNEEDNRDSQEDKNCSRKSCLKIKRYIDETILTDSESDSGGESSRRSRRSHSRSGKSKTSKSSGQETRKSKQDSASSIRKSKLHSISWSSEDEEIGSTRWKSGTTSNISRHSDKSYRGESGRRRIDESPRSHSLADERKSGKSSVPGEEITTTKRDLSKYIKNISAKRKSWSSEGGDSPNTNEDTGSNRWENEEGESGRRRIDGSQRSHSNAEKSKSGKPPVSGEESLNTKEESIYMRNSKRSSWSSEGGESTRRPDELLKNYPREEESETPKFLGEKPRKPKRDSDSYTRKTSLKSKSKSKSKSLSSEVPEEETVSKDVDSSYIKKSTADSGSRNTEGGEKQRLTEGSGTHRWTNETPKPTVPEEETLSKEVGSSYIKKPTAESSITAGSRITEGEKQRLIEGSETHRWTNETPKPAEDQLQREIEDSTIHASLTAIKESSSSEPSSYKERLGSNTRWTNEGTSKISRTTESVEGPPKCDPRCQGLKTSTVAELRIPDRFLMR